MTDFGDEELGLDGGIMDGAASGTPLPDNYYGAPAEQPTTPTGNGTGYYIDYSQNSAMFGTLQSALNYAINRDQMKFAAMHGVQTVRGTVVPTAERAQRMQNQQLVLIAGIALVAYMLVGR